MYVSGQKESKWKEDVGFEDWRGISLLSVVLKIYAGILVVSL